MVPDGKETISQRLNIAFRTDASILIGTGHVMRCLTLADALREAGAAECTFICRPHEGNLIELIAGRGHRVAPLPQPVNARSEPGESMYGSWLGADRETDAHDTRKILEGRAIDWLIVDHYAIDHRWEQALRPACGRLMVMDDLADRKHDCDLLLDPSLGRTGEDYADLLPDEAVTLLGPQFALLRPEFAQLRAESLARRAAPQLRHLLITMGGVDKDNATDRVLDALDACALSDDARITVVMGPHAPWLAAVKERAARMRRPTGVLTGVKDMAQLMTDCDLAIGAAGSTSWERCCLGLPTIQLVLADNQEECAAALSHFDAVVGISAAKLGEELPHVLTELSPARLAHISDRAARVCEGRGTAMVTQMLLRNADEARSVDT